MGYSGRLLATVCIGLLLPINAFAASNQMPTKRIGGEARRMFDARNACSRSCDCWYRYFPGSSNYCLGIRYWENGSYQRGLKLLKLAAGWANKDAQYALGLIYFNGHHVATNRALGVAWLTLANERQADPQIALAARSVVEQAQPRENRRAKHLLQQMRKKYSDAVAGRRAWNHLRNRLKSLAFSGPRALPRSFCLQRDGSTVPWSHGATDDPDLLCLPSLSLSRKVAKIANRYFHDMTGTVTVGPVEQVPASGSSD